MWLTEPRPWLGFVDKMMALVYFHNSCSLPVVGFLWRFPRFSWVETTSTRDRLWNAAIFRFGNWFVNSFTGNISLFFFRCNMAVRNDNFHSRCCLRWFILVIFRGSARNTWWNCLMTIPMNESRCSMPSRCPLARPGVPESWCPHEAMIGTGFAMNFGPEIPISSRWRPLHIVFVFSLKPWTWDLFLQTSVWVGFVKMVVICALYVHLYSSLQ